MKKFLPVLLCSALAAVASAPAMAKGVCGDLCTATVTIGDGSPIDVPITVLENGVGGLLNDLFSAHSDLGSVSIYKLALNPDPGTAFGLTAQNNTNAPLSFGFTFNTPISLTGTINATSSLGITMTDGFPTGLGGAAGVTVGVASAGSKILTANDFDAAVNPLNKGVDIGPTSVFGVPPCIAFGDTSICGYNTAHTFVAPDEQQLMTTKVDFVLTPRDVVSMTGNVTQAQAVPEPESYALMFAGLATMGFLLRRRT